MGSSHKSTREDLLKELESLRRRVSGGFAYTLFDQVPLPYQALDVGGNILTVNSAWLSMLGYDLEEVQGTWFGDYLTEESREEFVNRFSRFKETASACQTELVIISKDGTRVLVNVSGQLGFDADGNILQSHCILHDITEKRRSDKRTKDSEQLFRGLFETSVQGIVYVDRHGILGDANPAICAMLGTSRERLIGKDARDMVADEPVTKSWESFRESIRKARSEDGDVMMHLVHSEGYRVPVSIRFWAAGPQGDWSEGWWVQIRDISKALETEEALRKSESRYRRIVETANEGIIGLDVSQTIVFSNQVLADFLGYERYEILGRPVEDIFFPEERELRAGQITLKGKNAQTRYEAPFRRKDGSLAWGMVSATQFTTDQGEPTGSFAMIADITEVRTAAQELEQAHKRLLSILDGIDADIYVSDLDATNILFMNAHMRESFGVTEGNVRCYEVFRDEKEPCANCPKERLLDEDGQPVKTLIFERYNPKTERWYLNHDRAIEWLEGKLVHMHMAADITELKELEVNLTRAMAQAEGANVAKNEFLANMSHEIRTPLNGLLGMLQVLQLTRLQDEQRGYLATALESGRNLLQILNDILDLSKIDSGKMEFEESDTELGGLLDSVVSVFRHEAETRGVLMSWKIDRTLPRCFQADKGRLRQILFNLVGNAAKFTEAGSVMVEAYPLPITAPDGRTRVFFSVADTGIGIPEDKLDLMFDPFTQVDGSASRKYQGTGLGLGIVHRLVSMMDGNISVSSEIGEGTLIAFTVTLRQGAVSPPARIEIDALKDRPLSILVAEDERVNRMVVARLFDKLGHTTTCVENGENALEILRNGHHFDCVLMDIQMPGLDGVETTRIIRRDLGLTLPIIALTAHAMKGDQKRFMDAGMNGYVAKPYDLAELKREIQRVMAESAK